ncbi:3D domain-containing protein [Paenibacillus sp. YPG26]|uniref:3D domain-containing protein n=1 Tax=Paenibacillus sp. YPG26 TaxID=2878915 RepID=UPI00203E1722|nr:3D domain-containing protein [Paenibacillus sp. YPG26]USB35061.1 LysM peptidoglycan-binding domain-containing protein [Paenibacillus sp. YPG26]
MTAFIHMTPVHADTVHTAVEGDTYYTLSKKYGISVHNLMIANPKISPVNIYAGLPIKLPTSLKTAGSKVSLIAPKKNPLATLKVFTTDKVVQAWGKTFNYSKTVNVVATAYSAHPSENAWGPVDYYGKPLALGTIAVDPKVIPMGTKVLVTGHSHSGLPKKAFVARATDQGSAIKGKRIDIFIPGSQASVNKFGFQNIKLYVIK